MVKKKVPEKSKTFPARELRSLDGNGQYVMSAQRSIRNFGKRFMESEMTSILVKVGKILLGDMILKGRHVQIIL